MADFETKKKRKLKTSNEKKTSKSPPEEQHEHETKSEEKLRKKKRKLKASEEKQTSKSPREEQHEYETKSEEKIRKKKQKLKVSTSKSPSDEHDEEIELLKEVELKLKPKSSWSNLDLILSLDNEKLDLQRKVEIAFDFVKSRKVETSFDDDVDPDIETISNSCLIVYLNNWIAANIGKACLDYRCWEIFKFSMEELSKLRLPLSFPTKLLRAFTSISNNALVILNGNELGVLGEGLELYSLLLDCVLLLFSSHGRVLNANVDLWASLVTSVVDLVQKIYSLKVDSDSVGDLLLHFSCLVLEPFVSFLKVYPTPKNIFRVFVDRLLELNLSLLVELCLKTNTSSSPWTGKLLKIVEDIFSHGLFHPVHVHGFLSTHSMAKYIEPSDKKVKKQKAVIKSYHRHFFQKLEKIMADNVKALGGVGELYHLFVVRVKKQKGVSVLSSETNMVTKTGGSGWQEKANVDIALRMSTGNSNAEADITHSASRLDADINMSLFDLFVHLMEPLMTNLKRSSGTNFEGEPILSDVHSTLKSINRLLSSLMREKIYARTEDDSEGARVDFLKEVYRTVISVSAKMHLTFTSSLKTDDSGHIHMLPLVAKEIVVSLGCFLEIEYEVVANDLVSLWLVIIVYSAIDLSLFDTPERCLPTSEVLHLGCQLIAIFSELRQVDTPIFALCKAIRLFGFCDSDDEVNYSRFLSCKTIFSTETCVKSVAVLLCSQEFKSAVSGAIKSIPEGQVSGCIRQLKMDISESIEWMKLSSLKEPSKYFRKPHLQSLSMSHMKLQAELLGRALTEIYTYILDLSLVTTGNCILVGNSIKDLMTVVQPSLSRLVGEQEESVDEFIFSVTGRRFSNYKMLEGKHDSETVGPSIPSIFLFFFRLYISCRSLYRETISLMPPVSSRKTSAAMSDFFTAYSGGDWVDGIDWMDRGYFSWIVDPSKSLPSIIKSVKGIYVSECAPLINVLHVMALQRLVDLNRQIKAFKYLHERAVLMDGVKLMDDAGFSLYHKEMGKCKEHISGLSQEAVDITSFLMESLPLILKKVQSAVSDERVTFEGEKTLDVPEDDTWDLSVCTMTEKLLPTAIWWVLCQNTDVWSAHADKKELKKFFSCLFHSSSSCVSNFEDVIELNKVMPGQFRKVTLKQISLDLLNDTVFHEQKFLRRNLTKWFLRFLKKSVLSQFGESFLKDVDWRSLPDWQKVLIKLENKLGIISKGHGARNEISEVGPDSVPTISPSVECGKKLTTFQNLLNLLCWIPKVSADLKSFSVCSTYILNLERLVVLGLLRRHGVHNRYEFFRLFVHCRKALKCLVMTYCEENIELKQPLILSESPSTILWLLKSVSAVVQLWQGFPEEHSSQVRYMVFSLMDHTSYLFLTLSKNQFGIAVNSLLSNEMPQTEILVSGRSIDKNISTGPCANFEFSENDEAWKVVILMAENLKEQVQSFSLKGNLPDALSVVELNKLSSIISCIQGYCWGLVSVLENLEEKCSEESKSLSLRIAPKSKLNLCLAVFEKCINFYLHVLVAKEHEQPDHLHDGQSLPMSSCKNGSLSLEESHESEEKIEPSSKSPQEDFIQTKDDLASDADNVHESANCCETSSVKNSRNGKKKSQFDYPEFAVNILTDIDSFERQQLKKPLLRNLLSGENPEVAFSVRQLFIASSALLRLKLKNFYSNLSSSSTHIFISTSQFLLSELSEMVERPDPFSFVWLDGVLKYIEVLGSYISITNPTSSREVYARLINVHLKAIGKCISLQGKGASLASHESESSTKTLRGQTAPSNYTLKHGPYSLDEFKTRLRTSFRVLIKKPSELHLLTAVQALERALVGIHESCNMIYEISFGGSDGGKVSSVVAAGVDCFDLLLESVTGHQRLNIVKRHIQSVVGALFNIVLHLQGPVIFYDELSCSEVGTAPDPGSVILMCVEVLTKVAGKHAVFQMDGCHVGQYLRLPGAIFQNFRKLNCSQAYSTNGLVFSADQDSRAVANTHLPTVDQQFSVDLFAACCRLLCTVLRHHRSETAQCIFLLGDSVNVLLHSLETVDADLIGREGNFAWEVQAGMKSASFLRRIYEEIRHQKEVLGPYCSHFLSNYISLYSGYGPFKTGIRREIDEALRPGVYALIDACSPEDLQQLHTVLGEGPCRSTLATLQHDYKQNFRYEGKV